VDSSGLEARRRSEYYAFHLRRRVRRREFRKLHLASECRQPEKPIYSWELTAAWRGDSPQLVPLLDRIAGEMGDVCGDKAYASRANAQYVEDRGGRPFLMPKGNATAKAGGCPAWRRMVLSRRRHPRAFERRYHRRSNGEAVNSSFKRTLGSDLRSRRWWNQRREAALKVIVRNLRLLLRFRIRNGES